MPTGIEEAGIALAAVSLAFDVFAGCVKGFELLSTAHHLGKECEMLMCMLKLEEYRLMIWAKKSGLIGDNLDRRLDETVVGTALGELRTLLTDTAKMRKKYKMDVRDGEISNKLPIELTGFASQTLHFLNDKSIQDEQEKILRRANFVQRKVAFPKRLWFAAIDREGFEDLLNHISTIIQRLFDLLLYTTQEDFQKSLDLMQISLLSIIEKVDDIRVLTDQTAGFTAPNDALTTVAALRKLQIEISDPAAATERSSVSALIKKQLLSDVQNDQGRLGGSIALYEGAPVYIEHKHYSDKEARGADSAKILGRVQDLTRLLSSPRAPSFRSLRCKGYFNDPTESAYCLVFDRPAQSSANVTPRSLLSLLRSSYMPSVSQRIQLALDLTTTLLHIHAGGWLHKGLRSDSILFFPASETAARTLADPYILGYEYSRRVGTGEISDKPSDNPSRDIYRHPSAQGPVSDTFHKAFDIYALGIVLVEIAYWRSFGHILENTLKVKLTNVSAIEMKRVRTLLTAEGGATDLPQNLRFRMGDQYAKVALCCFSEVFEDANLAPREFIETYYELVINRLQHCRV